MAILVDATTPALVSGTTTCTTASFTAPANSLLVALCAADGGASTLTVTNSGAALTWVTQVRHQTGEDAGAYAVTAQITTAVAAASVARTVTLTTTATGSQTDMKLLVITGADVTGTPVGAKGEGNSTTNSLTANAYTSTVDGSLAVGIATDDVQLGDPSTTDVGFPFNHAPAYSGIAVHKAAVTPTAGSLVTLNFDAPLGTPNWNWAAAEILPAVIPFVAPRPLVLGQAVNRAAYF